MSEAIYCIDTSSLINLRLWRPIKRYPDVWKKLDMLIEEKRLLAPDVVLHELHHQDDALLKWGRRRKPMFRKSSRELVEQVQEILARFPNLVDVNRPTTSADPFVVALAVRESRSLYHPDVIVVTEENTRPAG